jgi:hypothetical protein
MQETYENIVLLLKDVSYSNYGWKIYGALKVISLLLDMQSDHIQLCCCLCEWDNQAKYKTKDWPIRENPVPGESVPEINCQLRKVKILLPHYTLNWGY